MSYDKLITNQLCGEFEALIKNVMHTATIYHRLRMLQHPVSSYATDWVLFFCMIHLQ